MTKINDIFSVKTVYEWNFLRKLRLTVGETAECGTSVIKKLSKLSLHAPTATYFCIACISTTTFCLIVSAWHKDQKEVVRTVVTSRVAVYTENA